MLNAADLALFGGIRRVLTDLKLDASLLRMRLALKAGFDASQPRVPGGNSDGGQWSDGGGGTPSAGTVRLAQAAPPVRRPPGLRDRIAGRWTNATFRQQAELDATRLEMEAAVRRVLTRDPRWRPPQSAYETIEGEISANRAITEAATREVNRLMGMGIGPGPYAVEGHPVTPGRRLNAADTVINNLNFSKYGCHTCGTFDPGTPSGNAVRDHQRPTSLNSRGNSQMILPQCRNCSVRQGGHLSHYTRRQK